MLSIIKMALTLQIPYCVLLFVCSVCLSSNFIQVASDEIPEENLIDGLPDKIFLKEIFSKYGEEDNMTFEGFEHLMVNLGLGGRVFEFHHELSLHRINGTFSEIHDVSHRHKRHAHIEKVNGSVSQCLSPQDMLKIYGLKTQSGLIINENIFLHLCPALVYQLDQRSCIHMSLTDNEPVEEYLAWIYAGLSVLLISATGLLGVAIMPIMNTLFFNQLLNFLVALAVATLCGDALLHLLPHSLRGHSHDKHDNVDDSEMYIFKCSVTLLTIFLFYTIESLMKIITGGKNTHGHSHKMQRNDKRSSEKDLEVYELGAMLQESKPKSKTPMAPVALMVILGDALHNITDGLAIGAAFSNDLVTGFATALAVFCHELPHELGDFAVLLKSGMSMKRALWYNVLSSVLSFAGTAVGLWLGEDHATSSQWIYAATAGTFLYIALVDLVPEMNNDGKLTLSGFCLSLLGLILGFLIMFSIALHEDSLAALFNK